MSENSVRKIFRISSKTFLFFGILMVCSSCSFFQGFNERNNATLYFNGGSFVSASVEEEIAGLGKGSFEVDFIPQSNSSGTIFQIGSKTDDTRHFRLYFSKGKLYLQNRYSQLVAECATELQLNASYHIAVTSDGSNWQMYIDGMPQKLVYINSVSDEADSSPKGWFKDALLRNDQNEINLGVLRRPKGTINYFVGEIGEFRLWERVLSTDEIKNNFGEFRTNRAKGLLVFYDFQNEGDHNITNKVSNKYNAKLIGDIDIKEAFKENAIPRSSNASLWLLTIVLLSCIFITHIIVHGFKVNLNNKNFLSIKVPKNYIKGLDGLRGISIILVIINHLGWLAKIPYEGFNKRWIQLISGTTGVNVFFAISGFLITLILLREIKKRGGINFKNFFARRFIRLLPPLVVFYIAIMVFMKFEYLAEDYIAVAISFFYLYNFVPKVFHYTSELGSTWSLAVEEQFYLMWPFVLMVFPGMRKRIMIICLLVAASIGVLYLVDTIEIPFEINGREYTSLRTAFFTNRWFLPAIAPIMIGAAFGILLFKNETIYKNLFGKNYLLLLVSVILFCASLYLSNELLRIAFIVQALGASLFLTWIYFNQTSVLTKILEFKPLVFIGKISYGLYIYQGLFLGTGPSAEMDLQEYPINIILTFLVATLSYFFIERKFLRLKKNFG